ncbi:PREDICTED: uncharacterized protein LOC109166677 [Ipomoea nil]|uniref:uncharacterized protein LOC109166677 n=1 Tax=Ipomoea nil TaxID=35883 RepID=UPI000901C438|nr:PREDICTED: uncharacterized protein LOC109166677 [Ipomoea nil]
MSFLNVRDQPITLQELADLLGAEEFMTRGGPRGGSPAAFTAQMGSQKGRGSGHNNGGRGSGQNNGQNSSQTGQPRGGGGRRGGGRNGNWQPKCQICHVLGHTASICHLWCAKDPQANVIYQETPLDPQGSHTWLRDTGATNHATPNIAALSFSEDYKGNDTLRVGDGMRLPISHIGHAIFNSPFRSFQFSNILHVPSLSTSLLFVQKFASDNKVFFEFHPSFFVVKDINTNEILLRGNSSGGLNKLPIPSSSPTAFLSARTSVSVWRNHLGHPHQ